MRTVLITGGAGFVGSNLARLWKRDFPRDRVVALDNLKRRGSEYTLPLLAAAGAEFAHGDVRNREDLDGLEPDLLLECSAEPSVQAGYGSDPRYLVHTNLGGTLNCLELARRCGARVVFLSTSRVYPIAPLRGLPLAEGEERFFLPAGAGGPGWSENGVAADFPLEGPRSLYGTTKLSSELFIQEYVAAYGLQAFTNRCGVLTGPWQMGKVDQGFFTLWAARFLYGGALGYTGFGGLGKQVRDVLHVADLHELIKIQVADPARHAGKTYNVGGGAANSVSLRELSALCAERAGSSPKLGSNPETHPADIPWYVTDNRRVTGETGWAPRLPVEAILDEVFGWLRENRELLEPLLKG
jgi:CDP-paratose 2-epimerase